jgi:hypothetical protein
MPSTSDIKMAHATATRHCERGVEKEGKAFRTFEIRVEWRYLSHN